MRNEITSNICTLTTCSDHTLYFRNMHDWTAGCSRHLKISLIILILIQVCFVNLHVVFISKIHSSMDVAEG
jgi:hypothetical protein